MHLKQHPTKQVTVILIVILEGGIACLFVCETVSLCSTGCPGVYNQVGLQVTVICLTLQPSCWD